MRTRLLAVIFQLVLVASSSVLAQPAGDSWVDRSPHKQLRVSVNGISLEYLDWGGNGEALVFLAGLGNTAHIFDDIAPKLTDHFHVLSLTRRGYGSSEKPSTGYDAATLVEDLHQFLDALKIDRVILVGHSFAGLEITGFAERFPERVDRLVYLDCAYRFDEPGTLELLGQIDSLTPSPTAADRASFAALLKWFRENRPGWNAACESDLRSTRLVTADGLSGHGSTPDAVEQALMQVALTSHADCTKLNAPILAFFADHRLDTLLASAGADDAKRKQVEATTQSAKVWWRAQIDRFKRDAKHGQVVELRDTDHFCFIQRQAEVVQQIEAFLAKAVN
jgi:pimeloyl-ACP methyl ester carboxylesterase